MDGEKFSKKRDEKLKNVFDEPWVDNNMTHNEYVKDLEITLIGGSPDGKLSGGARINTLINILKAKDIDWKVRELCILLFQS